MTQTSSDKIDIEKLLGPNAAGFAKTLSADAMLLDKLVSAFSEIRKETTERAQSRFRLTKSYWPNVESGKTKNLYVSWSAHDAATHQDIEVIYDFEKQEYRLKESRDELSSSEEKHIVTTFYAILPVSEITMIRKMQTRYDEQVAIKHKKVTAGGR